jgi:hypothetical protein
MSTRKDQLQELKAQELREDEEDFRRAIEFFRHNAHQLNTVINYIKQNQKKFPGILNEDEKRLIESMQFGYVLGTSAQCNLF